MCTNKLPANPVLTTEHNHSLELAKLEVDRCTEMRIRAAASKDPPAHVYSDNVTGLTDAAKAILSSVNACKHTIPRNRTQEYPEEPANMSNLRIVSSIGHAPLVNNVRNSSSLTMAHKQHP